MDAGQRIRMIRLIEQMERNPEFSKRIGLTNASRFLWTSEKGKAEHPGQNRKINIEKGFILKEDEASGGLQRCADVSYHAKHDAHLAARMPVAFSNCKCLTVCHYGFTYTFSSDSFCSPSGKIILNTKKKITIDTPPVTKVTSTL